MPPFLFLQGEEDPIIPVAQACASAAKCASVAGAEFFKIAGAGHGTGCWTPRPCNSSFAS
jgi:pimeloyl-ACP methyl ester carboxylesterase